MFVRTLVSKIRAHPEMLCVFWYMYIDMLICMRDYIVLTTSSEDEYNSDMSSEDNQELQNLFLVQFANAICIASVS